LAIKKVSFSEISGSPSRFLAFGFGSGLAPKAPGTCGTLAAVPIYLLLMDLPLTWYLTIVLVFTVYGVWICGVTSRYFDVPDHPGIVWDEIVGFLITMIAAPSGFIWIVIGFLLFRLFDIWKPWPICLLDRHVHGGLGIMIDDVVAGIFAAILMNVIAALI